MTQMNGTGAVTTQTGITGIGASSAPAAKPAIEEVAQQFEAIFLRQMIGAMRSSSLAEGMFDSSATQQFQDMADARTADEMSRKGSIGIADMLIRQFGQTRPQPAAATSASAAAQAMSIIAQRGDAS